jgi:hypothetical protein
MREFKKSKKLDKVSYDIRGPIMDEANRLRDEGVNILRLNLGNPGPFGYHAPEVVTKALSDNLLKTEGYSDSKGLKEAREAILEYCKFKGMHNVSLDDIYTGNGVSELIQLSMQALLDEGDEVLIFMAQLLNKYCKNSDTPYRYGGEEFAIIFNQKGIDEVYDTVKKILAEFSASKFSFTDSTFTFSAGIAESVSIKVTAKSPLDLLLRLAMLMPSLPNTVVICARIFCTFL